MLSKSSLCGYVEEKRSHTLRAVTLTPAASFRILLAEGYASLAAEILALRRMMVPFAGSAVSVTAVLLAVYLPSQRAPGSLRGSPAAPRHPAGGGERLVGLLAERRRHAAGFRAARPGNGAGRRLLRRRHRPHWLAAGRMRPAGPRLRAGRGSLPHRRGRVRPLNHRERGRLSADDVRPAALLGDRRIDDRPGCRALPGRGRRPPAQRSRRRAAGRRDLPRLDLWGEAAHYVERNAYADYCIVELEDGGRMLDVSGQAALRHNAARRGWAGALPAGWTSPSSTSTPPRSGSPGSSCRRAGGSLYVNHRAWLDDELFRTRAERTLRSVFADCSTWLVGIEEGRGWHAAREEPGSVLFRCRKSTHDGDRAIYSDAVPRADLDRSLR